MQSTTNWDGSKGGRDYESNETQVQRRSRFAKSENPSRGLRPGSVVDHGSATVEGAKGLRVGVQSEKFLEERDADCGSKLAAGFGVVFGLRLRGGDYLAQAAAPDISTAALRLSSTAGVHELEAPPEVGFGS
jgi:hypothetical protein